MAVSKVFFPTPVYDALATALAEGKVEPVEAGEQAALARQKGPADDAAAPERNVP